MRHLRTTTLLATTALLSVASAQTTFRIGYQKGGLLAVLKARGTLDRAAKAQGIDVTWTLFTAGLPLLEAQNAGAIDFGSVGNAPGVFAISGGADLRWVAVSESAKGTGEAFIVRRDSPIRTLRDLKGKRVAVFRGSSAHTFFIRALREAGLKPDDVEIVSLVPADARPAFDGGAVDAWVVWDPYLSIALKTADARVLKDESGVNRALRNGYFLVPAAVTKDRGKQRALQLTLTALQDTARWANANPDRVARQYAEELGLPDDIARLALSHSLPFNVRPFTARDLGPLQTVLDTFVSVKALPTSIKLGSRHFFDPTPTPASTTREQP